MFWQKPMLFSAVIFIFLVTVPFIYNKNTAIKYLLLNYTKLKFPASKVLEADQKQFFI